MHHEINNANVFKAPKKCMHACNSIHIVSNNLRSEKVIGDNVGHLGRVGGGRVQIVLVGSGERVDGVSPDHCRQGRVGVSGRFRSKAAYKDADKNEREMWSVCT